MPRHQLIILLVLLTSPAPSLADPAPLGGPADARAPAWHPDGNRLAMEQQHNGQWDIHVHHLADASSRPLVEGPADERWPAWSADGRQLAFVRRTGDRHQLVLQEADGGERLLLEGAEAILHPAWHPDGSRLGIGRQRDGVFSLEVVDVTSGRTTPVPLAPGRDLWPRWSPDGATLAFFTRRFGSGQQDAIALLQDGADTPLALVMLDSHAFCPAWSPDGQHVAFVRSSGSLPRALLVVDRHGHTLASLAEGWHRVTEPSWSPDGQWIAVAGRPTADSPWRIHRLRISATAHPNSSD